MQNRQRRRWYGLLALAAVLATGTLPVPAAQPSAGGSPGDRLAAVVTMLWEQLGLGAKEQSSSARSGNGAEGESVRSSLGTVHGSDGAETGGDGSEMGPYISPDG